MMPTVAAVALCAGTLIGVSGAAVAQQEPVPAPAAGEPAYTNLPLAERTGPYKRVDIHGKARRPGFGPPPPGYHRILGHPDPTWTAEGMQTRALGPINWQLVGPRPISSEYWSGNNNASGRVVGIAPHPTDANTVYIASASGGVWKTTNGGTAWAPISDELPSLNHGAIGISKTSPDTLYVGTGEYTTQSLGAGIFKTTDGGSTWSQVATTAQVGNQFSGIAVDPTNANIVHATGISGYFRSLNGGSTWTQVLFSACSGLVVDQTNPSRVFVGVDSDGVYRSTDGGATFTRLSTGLPAVGAGQRRVVVAMGVNNPSVVVAAMANSSSGVFGTYRSADGGNTWSQLTATPNFASPQAWYDMYIAVDPANSARLFAGGVDPRYAVSGIIRSTTNGASWSEISNAGGTQTHPDHHAIAFGPTGIVWEANDGGVWKSTTGGSSWVNTNATLAITQNYQLALHPTNPNIMMTGTQDNGTVGKTSASLTWPQILAGDGGYLAYDFSNPSISYTTYVALTVYRVIGGGATDISGPWSGDSRAFIAPITMDPVSPTTLYAGSNRVWRTTNATANPPTWTAISTSTVASGSTLNVISVAPSNTQVIYTGANNGRVFVTTNGGGSWTQRNGTISTGPSVADIEISPTSSATAYIAMGRTSGVRVAKTTSTGASWTNVSASLPAGVTPTALAVDWDRAGTPHLYLGTGAGIYVSTDDGATWVKDGAEFPNVNVGDIRIDRAQKRVVAATYGRGVWAAPLPLCQADIDGDYQVDLADFFAFLNGFDTSDVLIADINDDNTVDLADFFDYLNAFDAGC